MNLRATGFAVFLLGIAGWLPIGAAAEPAPMPEPSAALAAAQAAEPDRLDLRWRLLRALYYEADFGSRDEAEKAARYAAGRDVAEAGRLRLMAQYGDVPDELGTGAAAAWVDRTGLEPSDVGRFYFWSSIHWGGWSQSAGLLRAVREGAAERLRSYTQVALELDPRYERGGPHRLMSRLHGTLPRVPFLSGWVDRDIALLEAERALAVAPADPRNLYLLAITLLEHAPDRSEEAQTILAEVSGIEPRQGLEHEDLAVREASRERLAEERARAEPR